ncbi:MAG: ABC transporter permease subunit, partial [Candidatus Nanopelagicales bacterium]|nr:ABC transporter permease subunit [Candidatus Nanopelagicales bacterium]
MGSGAGAHVPDPDLVAAARVLGDSRRQAFARVTWPLLRPAVRASATIVFLFCFTSFGVVQVLGAGQLRTVEVEIYRRTALLLDLPAAAALSLLQLLTVVAMLVVLGGSRATSTSAAVDVARVPRGVERAWVAMVAILTSCVVLAPLLVVLLRSLVIDGEPTLAGWQTLFGESDSTNAVDPWSAVLASLRTASAATVLAVLVGGSAALGLAWSRRGGWMRSLDALLLLPLGTSAVTVGLGMLLAFGRPPLDLRNTGVLIIL